MFQFEKSITINRNPHDVFAFIANPANARRWRSDVVAVNAESWPVKAGDKFEEITNSPKPETSVVKITEMVPDRKLVMRVISGNPYSPVRELTVEEENEHTKLTAKVSAKSDGFYHFIEPLSSNMYSLKWDGYLFSLKNALESGPAD